MIGRLKRFLWDLYWRHVVNNLYKPKLVDPVPFEHIPAMMDSEQVDKVLEQYYIDPALYLVALDPMSLLDIRFKTVKVKKHPSGELIESIVDPVNKITGSIVYRADCSTAASNEKERVNAVTASTSAASTLQFIWYKNYTVNNSEFFLADKNTVYTTLESIGNMSIKVRLTVPFTFLAEHFNTVL